MDTDTLTIDISTAVNTTNLATNQDFCSENSFTHWLPRDKFERDRLTEQHFAFKELLKGNICPVVKESLDFEGGISILNVGCDSGEWMADMYADYPNCTYQGCDVTDASKIFEKTPHLNFTYGNVAQKLPFDDNEFDFLYMRLFVYTLGADEWSKAIKEAIRVIKPGGMVQIVDCTSVLPEDTSSVCYQVTTALNEASSERGQIPDIVHKLEALVCENRNIEIERGFLLTFNTNNGTPLAKKYICDIKKMIEDSMDVLGPRLGVESEKEKIEYLKKFEQDMFTNGYKFSTVSLSFQKMDTETTEPFEFSGFEDSKMYRFF
ncbi:hypothetical protein BY458DRAFT_558066 [Sporodiniella umbellata]|nr:hypothetical protein BY458DRAFT_558066 [Sporodiniella umbellata]